MKIQKSFKIALNIIFHSKLRSWLTIIGIVIGIAAIVSIVSLGQGAQRTLEQNLNSLSADIITVSPGASRAFGAGAEFRGLGGQGGGDFNRATSTTAKNLSVQDVLILKSVSNVLYVTGIISGNEQVSYLSKTARVSIQGVDPAVYKNFQTTPLLSGRYLTQGDINSVVVGSRVANSTFSDVQINRQIIIANKTFKIVGILKASGGNDDSRIFMPLISAVNTIENKDEKSFDSIIIKIKDISQTDNTITEITNKLMISHGILQNKRQDFSVTSLKSVQERVSSTMSSMSLFLSAIAAVSLLVGAIGIMNTMFTSVLEKTKEIGILKALGAKNKDILIIFLLNSGIIGFIGGVFGIILGIIASSYIGQLVGGAPISRGLFSSAYVSPQLAIGVFVLAILVGLIAGAIPAYRASRLKPVDALRYE
jgi:putative ABC transport system permease protein